MNNGSRTGIVLCAVLVSLLSGCASWTNPVANGIPVRLVPDELLAERKADFKRIPWGLLQRSPPEKPIIQPEDVLGVYIVGVLGTENQLPPVQLPDASNVPPALGFPIPVRSDGTIPLPMIDDPIVAGMTVEQAEEKIIEAYTETEKILQPDQSIILTMIRPRHVRVLVVRQDSIGSSGAQFFNTGRGFNTLPVTTRNRAQTSRGFELEIAATEADVLSALAQSGGLPGIDAKDEILIYRKANTGGEISANNLDRSRLAEPQRIPLKVRLDDTAKIPERAVTLGDGDILVVEVKEAEQYYTGGLMINREIPLPLDFDLTVVEAIARGGGPMINGGFGGANLNGSIINTGIGNPNPSLVTVLRQSPDGRQIPIRVDLNEALRDPRENIIVKNDDVLILQETTGESFSRYLSSIFNLNFFRAIGNSGSVTVGPLP